MIATLISNLDQVKLIERMGMRVPFDLDWWARNLKKGSIYLYVDHDNRLDYAFRFTGKQPIVLAFERFVMEIM